MPITLKHDFDETDEFVVLKVNIKGVNRSGLDFVVSDCYVKVNSPPHFLEIDLLNEIELDTQSRNPKIEEHALIFTLKKKERIVWGSARMIVDQNHTKEYIEKRRQESKERLVHLENKEREEKKRQKLQEENRLLEKQWEADKQRREEIERKKLQEKEEASKELGKFHKEKEDEKEEISIKEEKNTSKFTSVVPRAVIEDITEENSIVSENKKQDNYSDFTAPVRNSGGVVKLTFTPRILRSPAREDKDSETLKKYEIWKRKTKKAEFEGDVLWVMERGDKFYKKENYTSAISAYSEALKMNESIIVCYVKRAACYLQRKEYLKAIEDCSKFLQADSTGVEIDDNFVSDALSVRSKARKEIGEIKEALDDIKLSFRIDPSIENQKLLKSLEKLSSSDNTANTVIDKGEEYKEKGDVEYLEGNFLEAIKYYTDAINFKSFFFKAYSNRAACYVQLHLHWECIEDCTFILDNIHDKKNYNEHKASYILKSFIRRGTAYFALGDFEKSYKDYEQASRMAPDDEDIMADLEKVNKELTSQIQADWLKNTANNFYKNQNYLSAIHSYELAIKLDKSNPVYYSNIAQCYLKIGDFVNCVRHCNLALSVLNEEDEKKVDRILEEEEKGIDRNPNEKEKEEFPTNPKLTPHLQVKLYLKRAVAYKELEEYEKAYNDATRANQLEPYNKEVKQEFEEIQKLYNDFVSNKQLEKVTTVTTI